MSNAPSEDAILRVPDAVIDLFDTMLSMPVKPFHGEPPEREGQEQLMVGSVSLAGEVQGRLDLCVRKSMARRMSAAMRGMALEAVEDGKDVGDVLREVCIITAGDLQSYFGEAGLTCEISTPSITSGSNFEVQPLNMERSERFDFVCEDEHFHVAVAVKFQAAGEEDPKSVLPLKKIDIDKFQRLDIISSLGDSIVELFDTMLSLDVERSDREPFEADEDFRVMGSIDFTGHIKGGIQFQVPKLFGRMMAAAVRGEELEQIQDVETVKDVIGEMTNILGGHLKAAFGDAGFPCQISTPSLTVGLDFHIEIPNLDRYVRFAFNHNDHDILVEACATIDEGEGGDPAKHSTAAEKAAGAAPMSGDVKPQGEHIAEAMSTPCEAPFDVGLIRDIPVHISVELGRSKMAIKDVMALGRGSAIVLANLEGEPLDIRANNRLIAKGEVLVENDKYGIRIKEIITSCERLDQLMR
jgi:flagellar motor switch protein FliN